MRSVPLATVVGPAYVFAPVRVSIPLPDMVRPLIPETTPCKVVFPRPPMFRPNEAVPESNVPRSSSSFGLSLVHVWFEVSVMAGSNVTEPAVPDREMPLLPRNRKLPPTSERVTGLLAVTVSPLSAMSASARIKREPAEARLVRYTSVEAPGIRLVSTVPNGSVFQLEVPLVKLKLLSTVKLLEVQVSGSSTTTPPSQYAAERPLMLVGVTTTEVAVRVSV